MSDRSVEYNVQAEVHNSMAEDAVGNYSPNQGIFTYNMEESLAENMYNLSMESDLADDDVDLTPTPSSRPPPEPFCISDYSEDTPAEMENMTSLAAIGNMIEKHNTEYPDVRALMKCIEPGFFKYGTILAELEKWSWSTQEYLEENDYNYMDADTSYKP